jgi:UDP-N-acetylmuramoyl-L-alanyl-D-glutamate--2,6-diaminopimelate ligase
MWQKTKNLYHLGVAIISNAWFNFPSRKLRVIGVTGTDGKTTTTSLIYHILHSAGLNASMVSSVGAIIGGKNFDVGFHVTTPSSFSLQRFLNKAVANGKTSKHNFLVLETTSHALDQYRVFGIKYDIGVLTNVTHEHLDYHKTYENYVKTKIKLFKMSNIAITNKDDESYDLINSKFKMKNSYLITYGMAEDADVNPINFPFETDMVGDFNKYNVLAAISACKALGVKDNEIREAIKSFIPPRGREDIVYDKDFKVMIDFAHTPNAFKQILRAVRGGVKGRIIHAFGSAGLRDITKRPIMGENSSRYADIIILTSEDPRTESVEQINAQIKSGIINKKTKVFQISDRKEAIERAIGMAKKGDFILITGKAHEKSMNYGHGEVAWDEYEVVKNALKTI